MSEQKQSYWAQLDEWTHESVIRQLYEAWQEYRQSPKLPQAERDEILTKVAADVKKLIREKVLESYRNGQAAGPRKPYSGKQKQTSK